MHLEVLFVIRICITRLLMNENEIINDRILSDADATQSQGPRRDVDPKLSNTVQ